MATNKRYYNTAVVFSAPVKLFAPTVSEAILDALTTTGLPVDSGKGLDMRFLHKKIEDTYCVSGMRTGVSGDHFDRAIKNLKKKKMIGSDGQHVWLKVWDRSLKWNNPVRPLEPGDTISVGASHFLYYVQWENDPQHVKIGYSSRPAQRFVDFLTSNPHRLVVLRVQEVWGKDEESAIHHAFRQYRATREWFLYVGALRKYIEGLKCDLAIDIDEELSEQHKKQILIHYF